MNIRGLTDVELMHYVDDVAPPIRGPLRDCAREIIRLREALREIERIERAKAEAHLQNPKPDRSALEISARALR